MNIKEMLIAYCKEHGFDGLCDPEYECSCGLEDLLPCGEIRFEECQSGIKVPCKPDECKGCDESESYEKCSLRWFMQVV